MHDGAAKIEIDRRRSDQHVAAGIDDGNLQAMLDVIGQAHRPNIFSGHIYVRSRVATRERVSVKLDRKSTRLNSSHMSESRMPSSA